MERPAISSSYLAMTNEQDSGRARRDKNVPCGSLRSNMVSLLYCVLVLMGLFLFLGDGFSPLHLISFVGITLFARSMRSSRNRRDSTSRRQSMETGFQQTVRTVASDVHNDSDTPTTRNPESGVYQVEFKQTSILDTKTNHLLHGGFTSPSVLTIQVNPDLESSNGGWFVQGIRKSTGKEFYVISEGFIAASGKAYWVETSSYQSLLVTGYFQGSSFTSGEWLSSNGDRGRVNEFTRMTVVEADTAVVLGDEALVPSDSVPDTPILMV